MLTCGPVLRESSEFPSEFLQADRGDTPESIADRNPHCGCSYCGRPDSILGIQSGGFSHFESQWIASQWIGELIHSVTVAFLP